MTVKNKQDYINYRIQRAEETLSEIDKLVGIGLYNTATNRLYYACFYAVIALLLKHDVQSKTHAGTLRMFNEHFVKTGLINRNLAKTYSYLFDNRLKGDYHDFFNPTKEDIEAYYPDAHKLVEEIKKLLNP